MKYMKKTYWYLIIIDIILLVVIGGYFYLNSHKEIQIPFFGNTQFHNNDHWTHQTMNHGNMITWEESFLKMMIPHHSEAIETSKIILEKTQDPELKNLLQNIISAQEAEVQIMREIIENSYKNDTIFQYENMMHPDLTSLSTYEAEKAYLEGMIVHHQGAIQMAQAMEDKPAQHETKEIIDNIIASQQAEIDVMKNFLENYK